MMVQLGLFPHHESDHLPVWARFLSRQTSLVTLSDLHIDFSKIVQYNTDRSSCSLYVFQKFGVSHIEQINECENGAAKERSSQMSSTINKTTKIPVLVHHNCRTRCQLATERRIIATKCCHSKDNSGLSLLKERIIVSREKCKSPHQRKRRKDEGNAEPHMDTNLLNDDISYVSENFKAIDDLFGYKRICLERYRKRGDTQQCAESNPERLQKRTLTSEELAEFFAIEKQEISTRERLLTQKSSCL